MPAPERFAWVWLATLTVAYGAYFATVAAMRGGAELSVREQLGLLAAAAAAQGLALGAAALVFRLRRPAGERPKRDERDRAIEHRAASIAYYVLIAGMIVVGCVMPFSAGGWEIVNAAILAIVVAEIVHHGLVVVGYRRGWRA